jgi:hypothetical protein
MATNKEILDMFSFPAKPNANYWMTVAKDYVAVVCGKNSCPGCNYAVYANLISGYGAQTDLNIVAVFHSPDSFVPHGCGVRLVQDLVRHNPNIKVLYAPQSLPETFAEVVSEFVPAIADVTA